MADSDDGSVISRRESHYNQQRSSLRSDRSGPRTPGSRPQSSQLINDFTLRDIDDPPNVPDVPDVPSAPASPSPAPVIPRRKGSIDKGKRESNRSWHSRRGSARSYGSGGRTESRGRNIDELLVPDPYENLNEVAAPSPVENWRERGVYRHSTLEEERTPSRESKQKRRSRRSSFRTSPFRTSPFRRAGTPASTLDITALPTIPDTPGRTAHKDSSDEYVRSKGTYSQQLLSRIATELYTISYLIIFSILGTLARLGIQWLTFYPGAPIPFSNLWANFSGTLLLGFFAEDRRLFRSEWGNRMPTPPHTPANDEEKALEDQLQTAQSSHAKAKKSIPLYIGLATGFCGSFTSFSSFMRDIFYALSNDLPSPINHPMSDTAASTFSTVHRNGGYSFMAVLAVIFITIGLCCSALKAGAHIAIFLDPITPTLPFRAMRRFLDPLIVFVAWGAWLGAVFMAIWPPDRPDGPSSRGSWTNETWRGQAIFSCVFAPIGCLLRFYVSLKLNALIPAFPLGTFTVNVFGTAVLGMAFDLQHVKIGNIGLVGGGRVGCQILQGIMDGFCGALTTVSTWILEIDALRRGHAYVYAFTSVAAGLGILVVVMGSVRWGVGWESVACLT